MVAYRNKLMLAPVETGQPEAVTADDLATWPDNVARFPQDGAIATFGGVLRALNRAVTELESVMGNYIAVPQNPATLAVEDSFGSLPRLKLPQIGRVTEDNWRAKIVEIAAAVEQCRTLAWPMTICMGEGVEAMNGATSIDFDFQNGLGANGMLVGPWTRPDEENVEYALNRILGGQVYRWNFGSMAYTFVNNTDSDHGELSVSLQGLKGMRIEKVVPEVANVPNARTFGANVTVWARGTYPTIGNPMPEFLGKAYPNKLPFNHYVSFKQESNMTGAVFYGSMETGQDTMANVQSASLSLLGIGDISFDGAWEPTGVQEESPGGGDTTIYHRFHSGLFGTSPKGSGGQFAVNLLALCSPAFPPVMPEKMKKMPMGGVSPGTVECKPRAESLAVHLGRGKGDLSQSASLSFRPDAFGSAFVRGSVGEFELIWANAQSEFGDEALELDGKKTGTFDIPPDTEIGEDGEAADWTLGSYLFSYNLPRLRQVLGSDVLADISYPTSYLKVIKFYWASAAGLKLGAYYVPSGQPFKTIVVKNPTAPEIQAGFPSVVSKLMAIENNAVYSEVHYHPVEVEEPEDSGFFFTRRKWTIKSGPGETSFSSTVVVETDGLSIDGKIPWSLTHDESGVSTKLALQCAPDFTPSDVDIPVVWKATLEGGGSSTRRVCTNTWNTSPGTPGRWVLTKSAFSGDAAWASNGGFVEYDAEGNLKHRKVLVSQKWHETEVEWDGGNQSRRKYEVKLEGSKYTEHHVQYSKSGLRDQFLTCATSSNGGPVTYTYYSWDQADLPWSIATVAHPGGYRQTQEFSLSGDQWVRVFKEGWDYNQTSGQKHTTKFNRWGGLVQSEVLYVFSADESLLLSSQTGSSFTAWGAPTVTTGMRGEQSGKTFQASGHSWGLPTGWTGPTGVTGSVSGYDHLLRPTGIDDGFSEWVPDYSNPLQSKVTITGQGAITAERTAFGEVTSFKDSRPGGLEAGLTPGSAFMKVNGRLVGLKLSDSREILGRDSGLGSRGMEGEWSVENGQLCRTTNELTEGNTVHVSLKTYFDGEGRVVKISRPGPQGSTVSESWEYSAVNRSVHYFPVPRPSSKEVIQTLSADGSKLEVQEIGGASMEYIRSVENGSLVTTTRVLDDSAEGGGWKQLSRQEYNPGIGQSRTVPWDLDTAKSTTTISTATGTPPTTTISSTGGQGDTRTVTLRRGRPERIEGQSGGVEYVLDDWDYQNERLTGVSGTLQDIDIGMQWDSQGRLTHEWGPGFDLSLDYDGDGGDPGFEVTLDDDVQDTVKVFRTSAVGDITEWSGDVERELSVTTQDLPGGQRSSTLKNLTTPPTLVPHLTLKQGGDGSLLQKDYGGGLVEDREYKLNGALESFGTGPEAATVTYGPGDAITTKYAGGLNVTEDFYSVGLRKLVSGPTESRGFKYLRGQLSEEKHTLGLWNNWTLARTQDGKGRVDGIGLSKSGETSIGVGYFYDQFGRIGAVGTAIYQYDTKGRLFKCFRDPLTTTWTYDAQGRIDDVHTVNTKGPDINFHHGYNPRGLRVTRTSTGGQSWTGMTYDRRGRLTRATLTNGTVLNYGYDDGGNRNSGGSSITYVINRLDQVRGRELGQRGYGVQGSVAPGARVQVSHPLAPDGEEIPVDPVTGAYHGFWTVTGDWSGGGVTQVKMLVRGTLTGAGTAGTDAVADKEVWTVVPATQEELTYDGAGRLVEDSEWVYTWNGLGHLTAAVRNGGTSREPDLVGEALVFQYDSDGRRVEKIHTRTYANSVTKLKVSRLMWDGWTPVFEDRLVDGVALARRKFVWGRDVSGTLDDAGGIGGLLAIHEVGGRTLLPVDDGLGNIVRVIDQATGNTVAKYDYAPYGELVEQWGELDACPFRYQSKFFDSETGLSYFGFRYYSARLGRWISRDPLGEAGGFNLYGYCGNDPVNRWDYLGLDSEQLELLPLQFFPMNRHEAGTVELAILRLQNQYIENETELNHHAAVFEAFSKRGSGNPWLLNRAKALLPNLETRQRQLATSLADHWRVFENYSRSADANGNVEAGYLPDLNAAIAVGLAPPAEGSINDMSFETMDIIGMGMATKSLIAGGLRSMETFTARNSLTFSKSGLGSTPAWERYYALVGEQGDDLAKMIANLEKQGFTVKKGTQASIEDNLITYGPNTKKWELLEEYVHYRVKNGFKKEEIRGLTKVLQKATRTPSGGWKRVKDPAYSAEEVIVKRYLLESMSSLGPAERELLEATIRHLLTNGTRGGY